MGNLGLTEFGLMAIVLLGIVALLCSTYAVVNVYPKQGKQMRQTVDKLAKDQLILRLVTVLVIAVITAILALTGSLNDGVVALFSSVVGYVLGGISKRKYDGVETQG